MARFVSSQWDFSKDPPQDRRPEAISVSELTSRIKRLLEREIKDVRVTGEISGLKFQASGHAYFTVKDAGAQLSCVLFRGEAQVDRALLQEGRKVVLKGQITVYEPRGNYQLRVTGVEAQGMGALQIAFEKLKEKLKTEGLFAPEHKRAIPRFCRRIGIVTSPSGAAIRDVLHVIERRNPSLELILAPCRVQGAGAAAEIARAIAILNEYNDSVLANPETADQRLDLILVTRGGGSLEDLWSFNEEVVARAIYASGLPVVSAVGHEVDFTISDFVADLRAATPSAGAEIITEGVFAGCQAVSGLADRLRQLTLQQLGRSRQEVARTLQRFGRVHPRRVLEGKAQRVDEAVGALSRCSRQSLRRDRARLENVLGRLARVRPGVVLKARRELLLSQVQRLNNEVRNRLREARTRLAAANDRLRLLGPEQVLARGYSITINMETGRVLRTSKDAVAGQRLVTKLLSGEVRSRVERPSRNDQAELPL